MSEITVEWVIPGKVLYFGWPAEVTYDTIAEVAERSRAMMDSATGPVHILNDAREVKTYPTHPLRIRKAMTFIDHPNIGWLVSITPPGFVRFLADAVPNLIAKAKSAAFSNIDFAMEHITAADPTIDWTEAQFACVRA